MRARRKSAKFSNIAAPELVLAPWPDGHMMWQNGWTKLPGDCIAHLPLKGWTKLPDDCIARPEPHIFDAPPPLGERHITLVIKKGSGPSWNKYNFTWCGGIRAYDSEFEEHGVRGSFMMLENDNRYVRYLRNMECNDQNMKQITSIMGDGVFNGRAIFVVNKTGNSRDACVGWVMAMQNAHCR